MERYKPNRHLAVATKRYLRAVVRHPLRETAKILRNSIIAGTAATALLGAYDIVSHANGGDGLTQGYLWAAVETGDCLQVGIVASHSVAPNEQVFLHIQPFTGSPDQAAGDTIDIDMSGKALTINMQEICGQSGVLFVAKNGELFGSEQVYMPASP